MLRSAGVATLLVGAVGTVIGTVVAGSQGLIAGALGTLIVLVFFSVPQNAMMVAMALYLVKIGVLLILLLVLQDATFFAPKVFAGVTVACTLAWTFVEVWVFSRTKVLYVEPGSGR